jgi:hypothetical protein
MTFKGLDVSGKKEDYINDLLNVSSFKKEDLVKMSFQDVLLNWAFYFQPSLLTR